MAVDVKEVLAETAVRLLLENKVKKLTVKDIVDECQLSRQAFYYHFRDIPDLLRWYLVRDIETLKKESSKFENREEGLRYFLLVALNADAYLSKTANTKYADEMQRIMQDILRSLINEAVEERNLYSGLSRDELEIVMRYHAQAIIGFLREWTADDTQNIDLIVHVVYQILSGSLSPFSSDSVN